MPSFSLRTPLVRAAAVAAALVLTVTFVGCAADDTKGEPLAKTGDSFTFPITEPKVLFPGGNCQDTSCIQVANSIYAGLVGIEGDDLVMNQASSVSSDDSTVWKIALKDGFTFHNGEPVDADAFIRAWNETAYGPNAQANNKYFAMFDGYDEMQGTEPSSKELRGVEKLSDNEIQVTLKQPFSQFPYMLSFKPAFAPLAKACQDDPKACETAPIGDGPYRISGEWERNQRVMLEKNPDYDGWDAGHADKIELKIYSDMATAFRDWQAGSLDVVAPTPPQIELAKSTAGDRLLQQNAAAIRYLGIPEYVDYLKDPKVREALSLAIDRELLIKELNAGLGKPARAYASPSVPGGGGDNCPACVYDLDKAKALMAETEGLPDTITMWVYSGGEGTREFVQAIGGMWKQAFGVEFTIEELQIPQYIDVLNGEKMTGPYWFGFSMDYPSIFNYLEHFESGVPTNYSRYANPEVDRLLTEGSSATSESDAIKAYNEAEKIILADLTVIPVFFNEVVYVWSDKVSGVEFSPVYRLNINRISVK